MEKIKIERIINAPIEMVWKAFSSENLMKRWWAPVGMNSAFMKLDFRENAYFLFCFKMDKDKKEYWGKGDYVKIIEHEYIAYNDTFSDPQGNSVPASYYGLLGNEIIETLVEFKFEDLSGLTKILFEVDNNYGEEMKNDMTMGWNSMFDKLDDLIKMMVK